MLDWAPMDTPDSGVVTHQNALLVKALKDVAYISEVLGKKEDMDYLLRFADNLKDAINRHLWDEEHKAYIDSIHSDRQRSKVISQQTNTIVYLCDCAEG
jgi:glycogen debranching enzyme